MVTRSGEPPARSLASLPIRTEAAECELEGPRITGPRTSLKILGASMRIPVKKLMNRRHRAGESKDAVTIDYSESPGSVRSPTDTVRNDRRVG